MADYAVAVPRYTTEERQESRYIYTIKPILGENELEEWEGTVTQLRRYIDIAVDKMRKFNEDFFTKRVSKVDEKIDLL